MTQRETFQVGEINELVDISEYPQFKFVRGFLSMSAEIRDGVNLALKIFHHEYKRNRSSFKAEPVPS
jgi:hypothetical protein